MSQIFSQRFLKRLRRQENGNRCLEAPADQQRARALLTSVEPAELASCESCCDKGVNVSDTLLEAKLPPAQWFDRFIGLGANSRHVSSDDTIACVRLVVAELQGSQAARETEIRLVTPTVPLSALYAECERLTGNAACWGVVAELQRKARAQQGVQPNQGVPIVALARPPANNGANWSSALAIDAQQVQMLLEQRCWPGV